MLVVREVSPESDIIHVVQNGEDFSLFGRFRKYLAVLAMGLSSESLSPVELKQKAMSELRKTNTYERGRELFTPEVAEAARAALIGDVEGVVTGKVSKNDMLLLNKFENTEQYELLTYQDLCADEAFRPWGVVPVKDVYEDECYEKTLADDAGFTHSATQFQTGVPPSHDEIWDASHLHHVSLGMMSGDSYQPRVTVLNDHYLQQRAYNLANRSQNTPT